jgi:glycosyltransferase involved in cell wall biosynthesis
MSPHVVLLAEPEIPIPPQHYGGIERIVHMVAEGMTARGLDVTLFAHPDSRPPCDLVPWAGGSSLSHLDTLRNAAQLALWVRRQPPRPRVIHSFARLLYMLPLLPTRTPKVMSYQRDISHNSVRGGHLLSRGTLTFTGCSASNAATGNVAGRWRVIHNGVPLDRYGFHAKVADDAPLVFLGRLEAIKGAHVAIDVARRAGRKLVIAGNVPDRPLDPTYADRVLRECDGERIVYAGPVTDAQKNELLGSAAALLFAIQWDEPFGIVMIEALACGTPVIAPPRGSVPEVVDHGVTGFHCAGVTEMAEAVGRLSLLDRAACRRAVETRFSAAHIVDKYRALYEELLRDAGHST